MNRLARILVALGMAESLVLCTLATLSWMRGHYCMDRIWVHVCPEHRPDLKYGLITLQSGNGGVGFSYNRIDFSRHPGLGADAKAVYAGSAFGTSDPQYPNEWDGAPKYGFYWEVTHSTGALLPAYAGRVTCTIPCWAIILVTSPGAAVAVHRIRRRRAEVRARRASLCAACGRDVGGTPDYCHCPFCGTPRAA